MGRVFERYRQALVFCALVLSVAGSLLSAFLLRFDFTLPSDELKHVVLGILLVLPAKLVVLYAARLHRGWWTPIGIADLKRILVGTLLASFFSTILLYASFGAAFPRSVYVIDLIITLAAMSGTRLAIRLLRELARTSPPKDQCKHVLIYGAGWAGAALVREISANPRVGYRVVGFLDDDRNKQRETVVGVPVLGAGRDVVQIVESFRRRGKRIDEMLIAMPSATGRQRSEAITNGRASGVPCKILPSIEDLLKDKGLSSQIRDISIGDLLAREPVELDEMGIHEKIFGRIVLVTGAAGSIGSELCRQIAGYEPRRLVLLDQAESDLFQIDMELRGKFPTLELHAEIGDIRDATRVGEIIQGHRVHSIFHAAAYKHVPLMESHAVEAANNNVLGTWNVAQAAVRHRVENFVLISSDKAVNPTNVMGATKRAAELILSSFLSPEEGGATKFVAVRFGNVLASNGSVVPLFQQQIAAGGPVTVTHPEVRRYFMTVREAVQLVLQAFTMGKGSEIFVLDMGEPVRIVDLAKNMIRLSGLPEEEVEIRFVGLRPGEKLYEELISEGENILPTHHSKIKIFQGAAVNQHYMESWISELRGILQRRNSTALLRHMTGLIPEYQVSKMWAHAVESVHITGAAAS